MKVLHVITSLSVGGAEKLMVDIIPRMKSKGIDVDLLLFDGSDTPFKARLVESGVTVHELDRGRSVYHPLVLLKLFKYVSKYDIIHTHNTAAQLFVAIASIFSSAKLCTTEHSTSNRRRGWNWYKIIDRWMYSKYQTIICISEKTAENLHNHLVKLTTPTITIHNGIDINKYASAKESEEIDSNNAKIVMVAAFREEKDQPTVIRSLLFLPEKFHVYFVGDGVLKQQCQKLSDELNLSDRVHFMGIRTDVESILKAADYVVMSSHWEGFGLAAVEGMAAGKPVIASDVPGLAEIVRDAGILFPTGDYKTLAVELQKMDHSLELYNEVAVKCKCRATEFDISKMVESYIRVYNKILVN